MTGRKWTGAAPPPVGTRFAFRHSSSQLRVYELVETLPADAPSTPDRHGCDRHTLRVVEESGYLPEHAAGVGSEIHVEDLWFRHTTARLYP